MAEQQQITLLLNFAGQANQVVPRDGRKFQMSEKINLVCVYN